MDHEGTPVTFSLKKKRNVKLKDENNLGVVVSTFNMTASSGGIISKVKVWSPVTNQIHTCEEGEVKLLTGRPFQKTSVIVLDWRAIIKDIDPFKYLTDDGVMHSLMEMPFRAKLARLADIPMAQWPKNLEEEVKTWEPIACLIQLNGNGIIYRGRLFRWSYGVEGGNAIYKTIKVQDRRQWMAYVPTREVQDWQLITERTVTTLMGKYMAWKGGRF